MFVWNQTYQKHFVDFFVIFLLRMLKIRIGIIRGIECFYGYLILYNLLL